jgi:diacylglycerol kinase family enzyme
MVNRRFNRLKDAGRTSQWLYLLSTALTLFTYKSKPMTVTVDGKQFFTNYLFSGTVGIGKYNGGGMLPMPAAVVDDGLLDLTLIRRMSLLRFFANFKRLFNGTIYNFQKVSATQGSHITIESSVPGPIEIDGEACGYSPFTVSVVPKSIRVVVGENYVS